MSPRKLTDHDKEELLVAYRETAETTSTLAARYGVSSSTISRFLKSRLSANEYEELIQRKRLGRGNRGAKSTPEPEPSTAKTVEKPKLVKRVEAAPAPTDTAEETPPKTERRRTRRKSRDPEPEAIPEPDLSETVSLEEAESDTEPEAATFEELEINPDLLALAQEIQLGDRQQALKELLGEDIGDDDEFDDEDDDDEFDDEDDDEDLDVTPVAHSETVEILPLEAAQFPRTCYVVTDRLSELIARPMQDFQDLGEIPDEEITQKTLPIFDNHRVAKRFIRGRTQKIIKVPNGELFLKTSGCLAAKGITRLLLDGKVYQLR